MCACAQEYVYMHACVCVCVLLKQNEQFKKDKQQMKKPNLKVDQ